MDLCVHFGKPAFTVFISSLYLYFGFSNKHFSISIQFQFKEIKPATWSMFSNSVISVFFEFFLICDPVVCFMHSIIGLYVIFYYFILYAILMFKKIVCVFVTPLA